MGWLERLFGGPSIPPTPVRSRADLDALLDFDGPVLLDIWSPTCVPCRKLAPVMTELATRYDGRVRVAELDVSTADRQLAASLHVLATPTVVIFDKGEEFGRVQGFRPPSWFHEMLEVEFPDVGP